MRGLSLMQPWASLVAHSLKKYETRGTNFPLDYRGPVAIHAAKRFTVDSSAICFREPFHRALTSIGIKDLGDLPFGKILAITSIEDIKRTSEVVNEISDIERAFGDYGPRRYAIKLGPTVLLKEPVPYVGMLGLWKVSKEVIVKMAFPDNLDIEHAVKAYNSADPRQFLLNSAAGDFGAGNYEVDKETSEIAG